nr:RNA-directed DNA polymerase, eukaryota, reverse transcriptase zinc-binding domain protein [Tanacetum cinerariifolium]
MTEVVTAAATQVVAASTPIPAVKSAVVDASTPISAAKPAAKPKILAKCLSRVVSSVIGDVKMAFIKVRQIIDGPLIVDEIIAWAKKKYKDFEKAFDSLSWSFSFLLLSKWGLAPNGIHGGFGLALIRPMLRCLLMVLLPKSSNENRSLSR